MAAQSVVVCCEVPVGNKCTVSCSNQCYRLLMRLKKKKKSLQCAALLLKLFLFCLKDFCALCFSSSHYFVTAARTLTLWGHKIQTVLLLKVEQYFKYTSAFGKRQKHQKQMHAKAFYWLNRRLICK